MTVALGIRYQKIIFKNSTKMKIRIKLVYISH